MRTDIPCPLLLLTASLLLATPLTAHADALGADLPILGGILTQATQTVVSVNEQLRTARESFDELRRFAGYADEAAQAYREFSALNAELLGGEVQGVFDGAFPELA